MKQEPLTDSKNVVDDIWQITGKNWKQRVTDRQQWKLLGEDYKKKMKKKKKDSFVKTHYEIQCY